MRLYFRLVHIINVRNVYINTTKQILRHLQFWPKRSCMFMQNNKDVRNRETEGKEEKKKGGSVGRKRKVNSEPCRYIVHGSHHLKDKAK